MKHKLSFKKRYEAEDWLKFWENKKQKAEKKIKHYKKLLRK